MARTTERALSSKLTTSDGFPSGLVCSYITLRLLPIATDSIQPAGSDLFQTDGEEQIRATEPALLTKLAGIAYNGFARTDVEQSEALEMAFVAGEGPARLKHVIRDFSHVGLVFARNCGQRGGISSV